MKTSLVGLRKQRYLDHMDFALPRLLEIPNYRLENSHPLQAAQTVLLTLSPSSDAHIRHLVK